MKTLESSSKLTLTGTITKESYEIYEENKETVYILTLEKPIKGKIYDEFMEYHGEGKIIFSVQVDISDTEYEASKEKTVTLTGNILIAHTTHHRRDIVLLDCVYE